jgi:hypothetical protein
MFIIFGLSKILIGGMQMEAVSSSVTLVSTYKSTRSYNSEEQQR